MQDDDDLPGVLGGAGLVRIALIDVVEDERVADAHSLPGGMQKEEQVLLLVLVGGPRQLELLLRDEKCRHLAAARQGAGDGHRGAPSVEQVPIQDVGLERLVVVIDEGCTKQHLSTSLH